MTRAVGSRSSKKRPVNSSQESLPEEYKNISPAILSQSSLKNKPSHKSKCIALSKENVSPRDTLSRSLKPPLNNDKNIPLPIRKSVRHTNAHSNYQFGTEKFPNERKALHDKTNDFSCERINCTSSNALTTIQKKKKAVNELSNDIDKTSCIQKINHKPNMLDGFKNRIPIYKNTNCSQESFPSPKSSQTEKKEEVYEFEVDENEEPKQKNKRKKRVYAKKPKIGPKALTINNIKYSSTESLVSLPVRPVARKKAITSNVALKSCLSTTDINDTQSTIYSSKSFASHPPTLLKTTTRWQKKDLSVLQESQSEQLQSFQHSVNTDKFDSSLNNNRLTHNVIHSLNTVASNSNNSCCSPKQHIEQKYTAADNNINLQSFVSGNKVNDNLSYHLSPLSVNNSKVSQDFLSSTPCKRISLVVCNNSVFDDSYDLPHNLRPSTGSIKNSSKMPPSVDSYFGFDEPEDLEEPLLSPIKKHNAKESKNPSHTSSQSCKIKPTEKPSIKEVIKMLKATVSKTCKETSEVDSDSPNQSLTTSPQRSNKEMVQENFRKPPRRSYERQRRVRYIEESEEESEPEIDKDEKEINVDKKHREVNKCYKKANSTKSVKSQKGSKGKHKTAKEEKEMEKLAALMNAQFQKIEKVNLVVE